MRDFQWLHDHNISVNGKILICKYGMTFRGEKVRVKAFFLTFQSADCSCVSKVNFDIDFAKIEC